MTVSDGVGGQPQAGASAVGPGPGSRATSRGAAGQQQQHVVVHDLAGARPEPGQHHQRQPRHDEGRLRSPPGHGQDRRGHAHHLEGDEDAGRRHAAEPPHGEGRLEQRIGLVGHRPPATTHEPQVDATASVVRTSTRRWATGAPCDGRPRGPWRPPGPDGEPPTAGSARGRSRRWRSSQRHPHHVLPPQLDGWSAMGVEPPGDPLDDHGVVGTAAVGGATDAATSSSASTLACWRASGSDASPGTGAGPSAPPGIARQPHGVPPTRVVDRHQHVRHPLAGRGAR